MFLKALRFSSLAAVLSLGAACVTNYDGVYYELKEISSTCSVVIFIPTGTPVRRPIDVGTQILAYSPSNSCPKTFDGEKIVSLKSISFDNVYVRGVISSGKSLMAFRDKGTKFKWIIKKLQ